MTNSSEKKRGAKPKYDHEKIKKVLDTGVKIGAAALIIGCSVSAIKYVRDKRKKRKKVI